MLLIEYIATLWELTQFYNARKVAWHGQQGLKWLESKKWTDNERYRAEWGKILYNEQLIHICFDFIKKMSQN